MEFLEPRDLALGERLEGEVSERRAAPEGERLAELRCGCGRILVGRRLFRVVPQALESAEVER